MGKRRDAAGEAIAGKGPPAEFFRRVSNSANEMMDYRASQGRRHGNSHMIAVSVPEPPKPSAVIPRPAERKLEKKETVVASPSVPQRRYFVPQSSSPPFWDGDPWDDDDEEPLGRW